MARALGFLLVVTLALCFAGNMEYLAKHSLKWRIYGIPICITIAVLTCMATIILEVHIFGIWGGLASAIGTVVLVGLLGEIARRM